MKTVYEIWNLSSQITYHADARHPLPFDNDPDEMTAWIESACEEIDMSDAVITRYETEQEARDAFEEISFTPITRRDFGIGPFRGIRTLDFGCCTLEKITLDDDGETDDCETIDRKHTVYQAS